MVTRLQIEKFLAQKQIALVGVSRNGKKFGNTVFRHLRERGYEVFPVNPHAREIANIPCYKNLKTLPPEVKAAVLIVPPAETERVVQEAAAVGIRQIWMQQGAESETAIRFCREKGIEVIHGECILMYAEPLGLPHRCHRWFRKIRGKLPH